MDNKLQLFSNEEFGNVRVIVIEGETWLVGKDVVENLGYDLTGKHVASEYINKFVDEEDVLKVTKETHPQNTGKFDYKELGQRGGTLINESGFYSLVLSSKLPSAKAFKRWVTKEVIPSIMRTGSYTYEKKETQVDDFEKNKLELQREEINLRKANFLMSLLEGKNERYQQILESKAVEIVTGEKLLPLPIAERLTYSATEIGERLGLSSQKVGSIANKLNLKTDEYGLWYEDKSKYSSKQVQTFRYYEEVIDIIKDYLRNN